jgi:hypothetical protein
MTTKMISRLRILDSILHRSALLESQPRSIDRFIDYFGEGQPRIQDGAPAK